MIISPFFILSWPIFNMIFIFSSTRSNSPALINTKDGITYSDVAFSALNHAGRYAVDSSLLASQIGKISI